MSNNVLNERKDMGKIAEIFVAFKKFSFEIHNFNDGISIWVVSGF